MDVNSLLPLIDAAVAAGRLSGDSPRNLRSWLSEPRYAEYAPAVAQHIAEGRWDILNDVFWRVIPFGTGGRRGKMYPIGTNAVNDRTIGESAQGLADYIRSLPQTVPVASAPQDTVGELAPEDPATPAVASPSAGQAIDQLSCAIAYDTRHNSRRFAELCAEVMAAAGFVVYFLDGYRSTPELSFAVRHQRCTCGIMVTASHNPPSDNAVKVYWSTGGQLLPPHDTKVIERVMNVVDVTRLPFAEAVAQGRVIFCQKEVDAEFVRAVVAEHRDGPRQLKVLYSPLHGVGVSAVCPVLAADGFADVEVYGPHAEPSGDFPNVPGHSANPEILKVFDAPIEYAQSHGFDLIVATDPDCDRIGVAAPLTRRPGSPWKVFTGNQVAGLLSDFLLARHQAAGTLASEQYLVKTLVTTDLMARIAESYGVRMCGNLHVGFKWIGGAIDEWGPDQFVLGCEESLGYLAGQYARDKDASVAAMLVCELAARLKADGQTLHEKLDALMWQHGCHVEGQVNITMPGAAGMERMQSVMAAFRETPPPQLGGKRVVRVRDYLNLLEGPPAGERRPLTAPRGDMVFLDLAARGWSVAVRPSGTEPKIKFYTFAFEPAENLHDLAAVRSQIGAELVELEKDLRAFAGV